METRAIDDDRAARLAEVRSELAERLSPVRGSLSDEQFARALTFFARDAVRGEQHATRQQPGEMR